MNALTVPDKQNEKQIFLDSSHLPTYLTLCSFSLADNNKQLKRQKKRNKTHQNKMKNQVSHRNTESTLD